MRVRPFCECRVSASPVYSERVLTEDFGANFLSSTTWKGSEKKISGFPVIRSFCSCVVLDGKRKLSSASAPLDSLKNRGSEAKNDSKILRPSVHCADRESSANNSRVPPKLQESKSSPWKPRQARPERSSWPGRLGAARRTS